MTNNPLVDQGLVALAAALSITLAGASVYVGAWPLAAIHAFVAIVLVGAYLRPMASDVAASLTPNSDSKEKGDE